MSTSAIKLTRVDSKSIELNVRELRKYCSSAIERRAVSFVIEVGKVTHTLRHTPQSITYRLGDGVEAPVQSKRAQNETPGHVLGARISGNT